MGLDWMLDKVKPRPGSERRFEEINKLLSEMEEDARSPALEAEREEITISVFEAIGAPRTGEDPRADEWFREHMYDPAHADALKGEGNPKFCEFWGQSFEECLAEEHLPKVEQGPEGSELLSGAVRWLKFWGELGFGYHAWY